MVKIVSNISMGLSILCLLNTTESNAGIQYLKCFLKKTANSRGFTTKNKPVNEHFLKHEETKNTFKDEFLDTSNIVFFHAIIEQQNTIEKLPKNTKDITDNNCYENPEHYPNYKDN